MTWSWFDQIKKLICSVEYAKIRSLQTQLEVCRTQLSNIQRSLEICEKVKEAHSKSLEECLNQIDQAKERIHQLELENVTIHKELRKLQRDLDYFRRRTDLLLKALGEAIEIPDISEYVKERTLVKPYEMDVFKGYDLLCADPEYYAFPKKAWEKILSLVYQQVKKILGAWRKEIRNCDNWALVTATFVALACDKAGLDRQGAFAVVWSRKHAFDLAVCSDDRPWLEEPQQGLFVGVLSKDAVETYRAWKIWFMS